MEFSELFLWVIGGIVLLAVFPQLLGLAFLGLLITALIYYFWYVLGIAVIVFLALWIYEVTKS